MSKTTDWMPGTRAGQLALAKDWLDVSTGKATAWNIPQSATTALAEHQSAALAALEAAQNETTRTPFVNAQCREAFDALTGFMRDFKRRYFLSPPLLDSDDIALGLKPHDTTPTPSGSPTAQATVETFLTGRHELGIKVIYVTGSPNDAANKGFRIWYRVLAPCDTPPENPEGLHTSFFTKRKKDVIEFDFNDSGKTAYFAIQIENNGKKGPWGPLVSALIP